jgi:ribosomal protein S18 acetylase RimI-like enzyme
VATVRVRAWREAYRNIVAAEFLDSLNIDKETRKYAETFATNPNRKPLLVAELDGRVVGYCVYDANPGEGEILALYVLPEMQRQGHGRRLVEAIIEPSTYPKAWTVWCIKKNQRAIHFYEHLGFNRTGQVRVRTFDPIEVEEVKLVRGSS